MNGSGMIGMKAFVIKLAGKSQGVCFKLPTGRRLKTNILPLKEFRFAWTP